MGYCVSSWACGYEPGSEGEEKLDEEEILGMVWDV